MPDTNFYRAEMEKRRAAFFADGGDNEREYVAFGIYFRRRAEIAAKQKPPYNLAPEFPNMWHSWQQRAMCAFGIQDEEEKES